MAKKTKPPKTLDGRPQPAWTPFAEGTLPEGVASKLVQGEPGYLGTYVNSRYQVQMRTQETPLGEVLWLAIVRRDRRPMHDWREMQRIKNELAGPEREAVEMYPAESRLVDSNNQYHLFVLPLGFCFPFGYAERDVADQQFEGSRHQQRPFEDPPADLNARDPHRFFDKSEKDR